MLRWFTAQVVEWRKTVSSAVACGVFSLLCSSFKLSSHDLASRSFHFILGLGLTVMKINIERLSEIWIRPLYAFYKTASWPLFTFLHFFFFLYLECWNSERGRWVALPQFAPSPLGSAVNVLFLALQRKKSISTPPHLTCSCWKPIKSLSLPHLANDMHSGSHLMGSLSACQMTPQNNSITQSSDADMKSLRTSLLGILCFPLGWKPDLWVGCGFNKGRQSCFSVCFLSTSYPLPFLSLCEAVFVVYVHWWNELPH